MPKSILLSVGCILFCLTSFAQDYTFGISGGLNYYNIGEINSRGQSLQVGAPDELFDSNNEVGFQLGAFYKVNFGQLFVRPELNYITSKNSYAFTDGVSYWKTSKLDLPLLIGYDISDPISVYAGPGINLYNDTTLDGTQETAFAEVGPNLEKTTFNLNVGVQMTMGRFGIDLRYEYGLNKTQEELLDIVRDDYGVNLVDVRSYNPSVFRVGMTVDLIDGNNKGGNGNGILAGLFKGNGSGKCFCPY